MELALRARRSVLQSKQVHKKLPWKVGAWLVQKRDSPCDRSKDVCGYVEPNLEGHSRCDQAKDTGRKVVPNKDVMPNKGRGKLLVATKIR